MRVHCVIVAGVAVLATGCCRFQNQMGTCSRRMQDYSSDYERAVERALPATSPAKLEARFRAVASAAERGGAEPVATLQALEQRLGLPAREHEQGRSRFEAEGLSYAVDGPRGRISVIRAAPREPMSSEEATRSVPAFEKAHLAVLDALGAAPAERHSVRTLLKVSNAEPTRADERSRPTASVVHATMTYALRAVEGVLVDGSYAKVISARPGDLASVRVRWPRFRYHPAITRFDVRARADVVAAAAKRVRAASGGKPVKVRAAVVLKEVATGSGVAFVPAVRIGVISADGETGLEFYETLLRDGPAVEAVDSADAREP